MTMLMGASLGGHEALVALLLERQADVNAKTGEGGTALMAAACCEDGGAIARRLLPDRWSLRLLRRHFGL